MIKPMFYFKISYALNCTNSIQINVPSEIYIVKKLYEWYLHYRLLHTF